MLKKLSRYVLLGMLGSVFQSGCGGDQPNSTVADLTHPAAQQSITAAPMRSSIARLRSSTDSIIKSAASKGFKFERAPDLDTHRYHAWHHREPYVALLTIEDESGLEEVVISFATTNDERQGVATTLIVGELAAATCSVERAELQALVAHAVDDSRRQADRAESELKNAIAKDQRVQRGFDITGFCINECQATAQWVTLVPDAPSLINLTIQAQPVTKPNVE